MKNKKMLIIIISILVVLFLGVIYFIFLRDNAQPLIKSEYELLIEKLDKKESFNLLIEDRKNSDVDYALKMARDLYGLEYEKTEVNKFNAKEYDILLERLSLYNDKPHLTYPVFVNVKDGKTTSYLVGFMTETDLKNYLFNNNIVDNKYKNKDNYISDEEFKEISKTNEEIIVLYGKNNEIYDIRKKLIKGNIDYYLLDVGRTNTIETEDMVLNEMPEEKGPFLIKFKEGKIVKYLSNITVNNASDKLIEISK